MARRPADIECMFCGQAPCVCNKKAATPRVVKAKAANPVLADSPEPKEPTKLKASPRRFSALDRMRAAAAAGTADRPPVTPQPAVVPAPVSVTPTVELPLTDTPASAYTPTDQAILDAALAALRPLLSKEHQGTGAAKLTFKADLWKERRNKWLSLHPKS